MLFSPASPTLFSFVLVHDIFVIFCFEAEISSKADRFEQPHAMATCLSIDAQFF